MGKRTNTSTVSYPLDDSDDNRKYSTSNLEEIVDLGNGYILFDTSVDEINYFH